MSSRIVDQSLLLHSRLATCGKLWVIELWTYHFYSTHDLPCEQVVTKVVDKIVILALFLQVRFTFGENDGKSFPKKIYYIHVYKFIHGQIEVQT